MKILGFSSNLYNRDDVVLLIPYPIDEKFSNKYDRLMKEKEKNKELFRDYILKCHFYGINSLTCAPSCRSTLKFIEKVTKNQSADMIIMCDEWNGKDNQSLLNELRKRLAIPLIIFGPNFSIEKSNGKIPAFEKDSEISLNDSEDEKD
ncbi:DgyrCDS10032 [Dimorphilus gyrociliatus]|uniref:DgyrCDS10032 n=1 Tax=Dimorphilus gyrociliatus TaxID=2664684 RepID=A0A7I8W1K4_9ANNE|nr:DgyrCDS10032 [Dimorphilus gyrociliatus]